MVIYGLSKIQSNQKKVAQIMNILGVLLVSIEIITIIASFEKCLHTFNNARHCQYARFECYSEGTPELLVAYVTGFLFRVQCLRNVGVSWWQKLLARRKWYAFGGLHVCDHVKHAII